MNCLFLFGHCIKWSGHLSFFYNRDNFTSSFPIWLSFFFFLLGLPVYIFNRSHETRHLWLIPEHKGKVFHLTPYYFPFLQRTFFNISCMAGLLATNSLKFSLSEKGFISPSSLEKSFPRVKISRLVFSFFQHSTYFTPFSFSLHSIWEILCNSYLVHAIGMVFSPLVSFKTSSLSWFSVVAK